MNIHKRMKLLLSFILVIIALFLVLVISCDRIIHCNTKNALYSSVESIPYNKVGLLPGTSSKIKNGQPNMYFQHRINAATELLQAGKIKYIIVSGDNRTLNYNEPITMRKALMKKGVPDSLIILDYAGLRTLDSVVRAKEIFGQDSITIISQAFQNERAIYIAKRHGIFAVGFNAREVSAYNGLKTNIREYFARVKVFIDILTQKGPRHLGEKITIPD